MGDKVKPWHRKRPRHNGKRIVPLQAGSDKRIIPLQAGNTDRVSPLRAGDSDYDLPSYDDEDERWSR